MTAPRTAPKIEPRDGPVYVVRWITSNGATTKQRVFRVRHYAERWRNKLRAGGWTVQMFQTWAEWTDADDNNTRRPKPAQDRTPKK
jgi:hypothetical protein